MFMWIATAWLACLAVTLELMDRAPMLYEDEDL